MAGKAEGSRMAGRLREGGSIVRRIGEDGKDGKG